VRHRSIVADRRHLNVPVLDGTIDAARAADLLPGARRLLRRIERLIAAPSLLHERGENTVDDEGLTVHRLRRFPFLRPACVSIDCVPLSIITDDTPGTESCGGRVMGISTEHACVRLMGRERPTTLDADMRLRYARLIVEAVVDALDVVASGMECPTVRDAETIARIVSRTLSGDGVGRTSGETRTTLSRLWTRSSTRWTEDDPPSIMSLQTRMAVLMDDRLVAMRSGHWSDHPRLGFMPLRTWGDEIIVGEAEGSHRLETDDSLTMLRDTADDVRIRALVEDMRHART
jgi:hypothetical protein